jgi:uncharacterized protein YndB with AHSA1/START domain
MNNEPLVIERILNAPVSKVWEAITDKNVIRQFGFDIADFKPEVGFEFRFEATKQDIVFPHVCVVKEVVPGKKLSYSWRYDGYAGDSLVSWELFPEGEKTKIRLTHEGLETIEVNGPDFAKSNFNMGWTEIIGTILKNIVEKK